MTEKTGLLPGSGATYGRHEDTREEDREMTYTSKESMDDLDLGHEMKGCYFAHRHRIFVLAFFTQAFTYLTRGSFNIALVAMVNMTSQEVNATDVCPDPPNENNATQHEAEFSWDAETQSMLLSAFCYSYFILQIPGGYFADRFGATRVITATLLVPGALTLLLPVVARWHVGALVILLTLCGLFTGPVYPAVWSLWGHWAPIYERTWLIGASSIGGIFGGIVSFTLSGIMIESGFLGGWPSVFYVYGAAGCVFALIFWYFAYDSPAQDRTISRQECRYIEQNTTKDVKKAVNPPWIKILTSGPVWAYWLLCLSDTFGFYTLFTCLPLYMHQILRFDISTNGILTSLPYIASGTMIVMVCPLADYIRKHGILSTTTTRKLATFIGEVGMAVLLISAGYAGCDRALAVTLLTLANAVNAFNYAGFSVIVNDFAPTYAGTISGIGNTIGNLCGIAVPLVVGALTGNTPSVSRWRNVFYLTGGLLLFGGLEFIILASGEEQDWARAEDDVTTAQTIEQSRRLTHDVDSDVNNSDDTTDENDEIDTDSMHMSPSPQVYTT